jgi:hypothetical protein
MAVDRRDLLDRLEEIAFEEQRAIRAEVDAAFFKPGWRSNPGLISASAIAIAAGLRRATARIADGAWAAAEKKDSVFTANAGQVARHLRIRMVGYYRQRLMSDRGKWSPEVTVKACGDLSETLRHICDEMGDHLARRFKPLLPAPLPDLPGLAAAGREAPRREAAGSAPPAPGALVPPALATAGRLSPQHLSPQRPLRQSPFRRRLSLPFPAPPGAATAASAAPIIGPPASAAPASEAPAVAPLIIAAPAPAAPISAAPLPEAAVTPAPTIGPPDPSAPASAAPVIAPPIIAALLSETPAISMPLAAAPVLEAPVLAAPVPAGSVPAAPAPLVLAAEAPGPLGTPEARGPASSAGEAASPTAADRTLVGPIEMPRKRSRPAQSIDLARLPTLLSEVRSCLGARVWIDRARRRALLRETAAIEAFVQRENPNLGMLLSMVRRLPPALKMVRLDKAARSVESVIEPPPMPS